MDEGNAMLEYIHTYTHTYMHITDVSVSLLLVCVCVCNEAIRNGVMSLEGTRIQMEILFH